MKKLEEFISKYEEIVLSREKAFIRYKAINIKTIGVLLIMLLITYFTGSYFNTLRNLGYLITAANVLVLSSFILHKVLVDQYYKKTTKQTYSTFVNVVLDSLYLFVTLISATTLLLFSVFLGTKSLLLTVVYMVLLVLSIGLYLLIYKKMKKVTIPSIYRLLLNGIFIGLYFYTVTLLVHINNIYISFFVVIPVMFLLILLKHYTQTRLIFTIHRAVVVLGGLAFILLSYPFTNAFNYVSFYRGEFTFRIVYETLEGEGEEFSDGITGEVILYQNKFVVVNSDSIVFYDTDFIEVFSVDNNYTAVYVMNDRLLANKDINSVSSLIDLYELNGTSFEFLGQYFVNELDDKVYLADNAYLPVNGYIYEKDPLNEDYELLPYNDEAIPTILEKHETFMIFEYTHPFLAAPDTFRNEVRGYIYGNVAYHNDHFAFIYSQIFVKRSPNLVNPEDDGKVLLYLTEADEYFDDISNIPVVYELPKLFKINEFYYIDNHYYLVGYIEYTTHDYNHKILVLNNEGELEREIVFDGPNVAISEDYIVYGNDVINIFPIDSDTNLQYRIVEGYGLMFFVMVVVSLFSIEKIALDPKKTIDLPEEK